MNIFLPYENDIGASVRSLDDLRLNKQILECYQLLNNATKEYNGEEIKGYKNHPVYVFYKDNPYFIATYGMFCCFEYECRFNRENKLYGDIEYLFNYWGNQIPCRVYEKVPKCTFTPYYMEGSKGQPNYIRTTTDVEILFQYSNIISLPPCLFQSKLISKWQNDKKQPKWSNRKIPIFYQNYLNLSEHDKNKYWEYILNMKRKHYGKS